MAKTSTQTGTKMATEWPPTGATASKPSPKTAGETTIADRCPRIPLRRRRQRRRRRRRPRHPRVSALTRTRCIPKRHLERSSTVPTPLLRYVPRRILCWHQFLATSRSLRPTTAQFQRDSRVIPLWALTRPRCRVAPLRPWPRRRPLQICCWKTVSVFLYGFS